MTLRIERQARDDLHHATAYYLYNVDEETAERFTDAIASAFERIQATPHAGYLYKEPIDARLAGMRVRKVPGFPYLLFYVIGEEYISVLAALHERRDIAAVLYDRFTLGDE